MTESAKSCDVSLVVSVYRSEGYLERFLENVERFVDDVESSAKLVVELVFVFNSPTALERRAGRRLHELESGRVRMRSVDVDRETLYASWNRGLRMAASEVLGVWNVDDCRFSSAVFEAFAGMRSGARLMHFPYVVDHRWTQWGIVQRRRRSLIPALEFDPDVFERRSLPESLVVDPFFMFSRSLYEEVGPFDEQFSSAGDLDWILRALRLTSFAPGSRVAGVYLNEHRGLSVSGSDRVVAEIKAIYARHGLTDLVQPAHGSQIEGFDVRRIRVGSAWRTIPETVGSLPEALARERVGLAHKPASASQALERASASLAGLADSGELDVDLTRMAAVSARRASQLARHYRAVVTREELEARLCRGDLRDARQQFLRARPAYASAARFAIATPLVMASPQVYAAYLRRVRDRRAGSSFADGP